MRKNDFENALDKLPAGYSKGDYAGRRYGVTLHRSRDGRRVSLFARQLAGHDIVSFNLYKLSSGISTLKPCEMPSKKVVAFVKGYVPESGPAPSHNPGSKPDA
jgi:hypothetical protein